MVLGARNEGEVESLHPSARRMTLVSKFMQYSALKASLSQIKSIWFLHAPRCSLLMSSLDLPIRSTLSWLPRWEWSPLHPTRERRGTMALKTSCDSCAAFTTFSPSPTPPPPPPQLYASVSEEEHLDQWEGLAHGYQASAWTASPHASESGLRRSNRGLCLPRQARLAAWTMSSPLMELRKRWNTVEGSWSWWTGAQRPRLLSTGRSRTLSRATTPSSSSKSRSHRSTVRLGNGVCW